MANENQKYTMDQITKFVTIGLGLSWFEIVGETWKLGRKLMRAHANEGIYEVLAYEITLDIHDTEGKTATVIKRQKVRYLQDNIIAYQDQAWGDGKTLLNYNCKPGKPVDLYRYGHKTKVLISLREVKNKGDVDEFKIRWNWKNGLLANTGFWGTQINHRSKNITIKIIFPYSSPPLQAWLIMHNQKRSKPLEGHLQWNSPNGRCTLLWREKKPRLYEIYTLKWKW